jgi:uncharacterized coiled-coil protein SlyX
MPKDIDLPSDSERLARIESTIAEHLSAETQTATQMQGLLGQVLEATTATRKEAETRGSRQDRAIEMVSNQVQSLGTSVAQVDRKVEKLTDRVDKIEDERGGITKQISQHEILVAAVVDGEQKKVETLDDKVDGLISNVGDLRLAVGAVTSALSLSVPRADGSSPPPGKLGVLDVIKRDNRASFIATVIVAIILAAQQLWPVFFPTAPHP